MDSDEHDDSPYKAFVDQSPSSTAVPLRAMPSHGIVDASHPPIGPPPPASTAATAAASSSNVRHLDDQTTPFLAREEERHGLLSDFGRGREDPRPPSLGSTFQWEQPDQLDRFLVDVYAYYQGKGIYCIVLNWVTSTLMWLFTMAFSLFLLTCIDYSILLEVTLLSDAINLDGLRNINPILAICVACFCLYWVWHVVWFVFSLRRQIRLYKFYTHALKIPDSDLQSIEWNEVLRRLLATQQLSAPERRLDEFEVTCRILRRDNYLVGLMNHEVLDLRLRLFGLTTTPIVTKYMEWCLNITLLAQMFDETNQLRSRFLGYEHRQALAKSLRSSFLRVGLIGLIFAPFMIFILLATFIFRYGEEIHRDPRSLGSRAFTSYAKFKFREFNEYPHYLERRVAAAHTRADNYLNLFPQEKLATIARLVAFVSGAFAAVLAVISIVDEDALLSLQITPGRSVIWYLGLFSAVFAVAHSFIPEEATAVFNPSALLREIAEYTHYMPSEWLGRLDTDFVRRDFASLCQYRLVVFWAELVGILTVPLVLMFGLRNSSENIVDFVRESTVRVDRVGNACCYATTKISQFGDGRYGTRLVGAAGDAHVQHSDVMSIGRRGVTARHGKMERSLLTFLQNHPEWSPPTELTSYLTDLRARTQRLSKSADSLPSSSQLGRSRHALARSALLQSIGVAATTTSGIGGVGSVTAASTTSSTSASTDPTMQSDERQPRQQDDSVTMTTAFSQPDRILGLMQALDRIYEDNAATGFTG